MIGLVLRTVVVLIVLGGILVLVTGIERRRGRESGLIPGVTLVTGEACTLCAPALSALTSAGVVPVVVDSSTVTSRLGGLRSLPVALVADERGEVVLRRSGRSVITDAADIAEANRAATT